MSKKGARILTIDLAATKSLFNGYTEISEQPNMIFCFSPDFEAFSAEVQAD